MSSAPTPRIGTSAARYAKLESERNVYLARARTCARYTIPSLIRPTDGTGTPPMLKTPNQSVGAWGTNNLSSKLTVTLFPPSMPCFRLEPAEAVLQQQQGANKAYIANINAALGKAERKTAKKAEASGDRVAFNEALKHLIVCGNVLTYDSGKNIRVFHLDRYVVLRDPRGQVLEIIVKETVAPAALPNDFLKALKDNPEWDKRVNTDQFDRSLDIYTHIKRSGEFFKVSQECFGETLPKSHGRYPVDSCPWLALRMYRVDGESYGPSYVEHYLGDLRSLDILSKAVVDGSQASAKFLTLVDPASLTKIADIVDAENGDVLPGREQDVHVLQSNKQMDLGVAQQSAAKIEERLSYAFLLNSAIQRKGERVTAEEVRYMAQELDDALGGVYALLTQELQLPYIKNKLRELQAQGVLPFLPPELVEPVIITGLDALGRGQDRARLRSFLEDVAVLGPENINKYIVVSEYLTRDATALGVDTAGLVRDDEEVQQMEKQSQMQALVQQLGPNFINAMGGVAGKRVDAAAATNTQEPPAEAV